MRQIVVCSGHVQENFANGTDAFGWTPSVLVGGYGFGKLDEFVFLNFQFIEKFRSNSNQSCYACCKNANLSASAALARNALTRD